MIIAKLPVDIAAMKCAYLRAVHDIAESCLLKDGIMVPKPTT